MAAKRSTPNLSSATPMPKVVEEFWEADARVLQAERKLRTILGHVSKPERAAKAILRAIRREQ